MERLTNQQLREVEDYLVAMTPGPYDWGIHEAATLDAVIEWEAASLRAGGRTTVNMVFIGDVQARTLILCSTGNGPNSPANARGIVMALRALPYLLDEVQQGRAGRQEAGMRTIAAIGQEQDRLAQMADEQGK